GEGRGGRAAVEWLQYRRFHLEIATAIQEPADVAHHPRARPEHRPRLGVRREIRVPLSGAEFGIRELAVPDALRVLFAQRERPERFGEERQLLDAERDLAGLGREERAGHADDVAQVEQLDEVVTLTQEVRLEVELDLAGRVLEMRERRL